MGGARKRRGRKPALTREQMEHALYLYRSTGCKVARIARHFNTSPAVIDKIIAGTYEPREDTSP